MRASIALVAILGVMGSFEAAARAEAPNDHKRPERDRPSARASDEPHPMSTLVWADGGVGYGGVDLNTFRAAQNGDQFTAGLVPTSAAGPSADLGLGIRLAVLTLGLRGQLIALEDQSAERTVGSSQLWSIDGELGFRIPAGRIEPNFQLAGGYSKFGGLGDAIAGAGRGLDIDGANLRAGLGLDYFVSPQISLGARASAEVLFLSRSAIPLRDLTQMQEVGTISEAKARALQGNGTSVGTAYAIVLGPGVHF